MALPKPNPVLRLIEGGGRSFDDAPMTLGRKARVPGAYTMPSPRGLDLGTRHPCPQCGELREVRETTPSGGMKALRFWSDCACLERQFTAYTEKATEWVTRTMQLGDGPALPRLAPPPGKTLTSFDGALLRTVDGMHPVDAARAWFATILQHQEAPGRNEMPTALYFYCPGKGRGKTHLASAFLYLAQEAHRRIAFVDEQRYLEAIWNLPFGPERQALIEVPTARAWLTVYDDIGRRVPGKAANTIANAWYDLIDPRYTAQRWTIFTSNYTPEELEAQGTISDATYSRIYAMTKGMVVLFDGDDQRLRGL